MSIPLLLETTKAIEGRIKEANIPLVSPRELNRWIVFHTFGVVTYVVSLRGPEGFLIDLKGLHDSWDEENGNFFIIALRGKIKGEQNARCHHLRCVHITVTGLRIRESVARLMSWKAKRGFMDGPAISDLRCLAQWIACLLDKSVYSEVVRSRLILVDFRIYLSRILDHTRLQDQ